MLRRNKQKTISQAGVPVSSMIDIVFLLIIFFVVTIDLDREAADQEITLPTVQGGEPLHVKKTDQLTVNVRQNGNLTINGQVITKAYFEELASAVASRWGTNHLIIIRADKDVEFKQTNDVMKILGKLGLANVSFSAELSKDTRQND